MPVIEVGFKDRAGLTGQDALIWYGPTLHVRIGFDPTFQPGGGAEPDLPGGRHPALVDTGATESCIDAALAMELGLPIVDRQLVAGVHGADATNFHLAQIYVPGLEWTVYGRFAGVHLAEGGQPHLALIGRTFLHNFTMTYEGRTGSVTISTD